MLAKRTLVLVLIAGCVAFGAASCSRAKKGTAPEVKTGLAARVSDYKVTEEEMLRMFGSMPESQKNQFKGPEGQANFVDRLIEQYLIYKAAIDDKMDKTDEMQAQIRQVTMNIIAADYFSKKIADKVKVDPKEVEAYYAANPKQFTQAPVMRAQYLFTTDSLKAVKWQRRLAKGEIFTKLASAESEDKSTAPAGGDVGYFNPSGYIKGVGTSEVFSKAVEKLEVGKVSGIIHFEKGFAIVRVTEKNPAKTQAFDDVKQTIEDRLRSERTQQAYKETIEQLKKKYPSENYVKERLNATKRTPEELWEMAQIEADPNSRIQYYRDIVNQYPTHKNAPEALFMIGFTYAEEIKDFVQARRTFDELEQKYPQSNMIESAKWMRENMEKAHPKLESMEGVQKRMDEDKAHKAGGTK
ncbi:MAG: peptidyl-prolyl cis-trans isomerase [Candidatus Krumholzibacteriaceae bacterium]